MKKPIVYTDEPIEVGPRINDFLPPPEQLIVKNPTVKTTLSIEGTSMDNLMVTIVLETHSLDSGTRSLLDDEMAKLGLKKTVPATEGGDLELPDGVYAGSLPNADSMGKLKHYYRSLIPIMRKLDIRGKYSVSVAADTAIACGRL